MKFRTVGSILLVVMLLFTFGCEDPVGDGGVDSNNLEKTDPVDNEGDLTSKTDPVTSLVAIEITETQVTIKWTNPVSTFGYIEIYDNDRLKQGAVELGSTDDNSSSSKTISNLIQGTEYKFYIYTRLFPSSNPQYSDPVTVTFTTTESPSLSDSIAWTKWVYKSSISSTMDASIVFTGIRATFTDNNDYYSMKYTYDPVKKSGTLTSVMPSKSYINGNYTVTGNILTFQGVSMTKE